jgi:hypothetical protein
MSKDKDNDLHPSFDFDSMNFTWVSKEQCEKDRQKYLALRNEIWKYELKKIEILFNLKVTNDS